VGFTFFSMKTTPFKSPLAAFVVFAGAVIYRLGAAWLADGHPGWLHNFSP